MKRRILLIRHGSHDEVGHALSGRSDIALNALGVQQAEAAAAWLANAGITMLHTSPQQRAQQTAAPIAARLALPAVIGPAMAEIDFGAFTGCSFAELESDPQWRRWNAERDTARCPGGETMGEMLARARAYLDALPDGTHAIVSHCDVIRGFVAQARGQSMNAIYAMACDPGSVTTLIATDAGWRVEAINERP